MYKQAQRGSSLLSVLLLILGFGFTLTCFLKLFPIYQDGLLVQKALKDVATRHQAQLKDISRDEVVSDLDKFFMLNNVRSSDIDLKKLKVDRQRDKTLFRLDYEVRINFMHNVDLVVWFKNELDSSKPEACCAVADVKASKP